jgi:hypothetical protein
MELHGFGYDLLRQLELGERRECRHVRVNPMGDDRASERADVFAGGLDFVPTGRRVERESGAAYFWQFGKSDYL